MTSHESDECLDNGQQKCMLELEGVQRFTTRVPPYLDS